MKKIFTLIMAAFVCLTSVSAATEQAWYNDVTSIANNGKYYIFSVGGNGFMEAGNSKVITATKSKTPSLFTITTANEGTVSSGGKYLKSYKLAIGGSGPVCENNTDDGTTIVWTSMSNRSYWNIHGKYTFMGTRYAGLYYKDNKYDGEIPSGSSWGYSDKKDTHTDTEYRWYVVSEAQYARHWAIYDYDAYKETVSIEQFKTTVYKDVYATLETAYKVTFSVKNAEHTPEVIAAAKKAIDDAYAAAEAYPAQYQAAKKAFDDALTAAQAIKKEDVTAAIYTKLRAYDEVKYDVVNSAIATINAATQALKDAIAAAGAMKDAYAEALAVINALDGLDKGENAADLKKINDDIAAAREAVSKAETKEALQAAVTAPALKGIDPVKFDKLTFDALQSVADAASSVHGQKITYTSADHSIVNAGMTALKKGTVKLTARTEGNAQYYPFERSAEITINAINNTGTAGGTVCKGTPFSYEGNEYEEGTHEVILVNRTGGDSVVTLTVSAKPVYNTTDGAMICPSELATFVWEGEHFAEDALVKTKTLTSKVYECDSTVTFTLTLLPTYDVTDGITVCPAALPYNWEGEEFNSAGQMTKTLKSINGCDSVVTFTLTVNTTYEVNDSKTIRPDELPYKWEGYTFTEAGVKTQTLESMAGCDSVVTFTLTVLPEYKDVQDGATICDNELPYKWEDVTFTEAGSRTKTLKTIHDCDSTVTFTLTVNQTYRFDEEMSIYTGEQKTWRGNDLSTMPLGDTELNDSFQSVTNCDSVYVLHLTVKERPTTYGQVTEQVCEGEEYRFMDEDYEAGEYTITTENHLGGDSIITLTVVSLTKYNEEKEETITYGETYTRGTETLTLEAGQYTFTDSLLTTAGCDSVIVTKLEVEKAEQKIEWTEDTLSIEVEESLRMKATASSGLPVAYTLSDETLATIEDNVLTALTAGELTITATQDGDKNYKAAEPVEQQLTILVKTALKETAADPEKSMKVLINGHVYIIRHGAIYTAEGKVLKQE
ncbi:MAG: hypothetical protein II970_00420 [Paludibacteraceae bacterium]|nr:hypothetical protein [Paludibacteraceae bacterium]